MAKIEKLPSGTYRTRVYDSATKRQKSLTAPTKEELKRLVAEFELNKEVVAKGDSTIEDAVESYISSRTAVASPATIRGYRQIQGKYFDGLNSYLVSALSTTDIQRFVNDLAKTRSPKTVRNIYGLLISSIRAVDPDCRINITLPQKEVVERHIPTDNDVKNLLNHAEGDLRKAIILASTGTMRRGEICSLCYEDIIDNVVHVHSDMVKTESGEWIIKKIPKTSSSDRYIEFDEHVIEELGTGTGRILEITPGTVTQSFIRLRDSLGIECRFHDLRHYCASVMHAIGVPDQYIMARGGWSSDSILKSVYRNVLSDKNREFSEKTNAYMNKLF